MDAQEENTNSKDTNGYVTIKKITDTKEIIEINYTSSSDIMNITETSNNDTNGNVTFKEITDNNEIIETLSLHGKYLNGKVILLEEKIEILRNKTEVQNIIKLIIEEKE